MSKVPVVPSRKKAVKAARELFWYLGDDVSAQITHDAKARQKLHEAVGNNGMAKPWRKAKRIFREAMA